MRKDKGLYIGAIFVAMVVVVASVFLWSRRTINTSPKITPAQYEQQFANASSPYVLIDVRTPDEFASGHIAGAINISVQTLPDRLSEVPHDKPIVVYCHSGNRSAQAAVILSNAGYTNIFDLGGILAWTAAGLPTFQ